MQRVSIVNGVTVVTLVSAIRGQSGIRTEALSAATQTIETGAYATVLDMPAALHRRTLIRRTTNGVMLLQ